VSTGDAAEATIRRQDSKKENGELVELGRG
jgi:hypothetical protein